MNCMTYSRHMYIKGYCISTMYKALYCVTRPDGWEFPERQRARNVHTPVHVNCFEKKPIGEYLPCRRT